MNSEATIFIFCVVTMTNHAKYRVSQFHNLWSNDTVNDPIIQSRYSKHQFDWSQHNKT